MPIIDDVTAGRSYALPNAANKLKDDEPRLRLALAAVDADVTSILLDLAGKSDDGHGHAMSEITGLVAALSGKISVGYHDALDDLSDVSTSGAANGQVLIRQGSAWIPISLQVGNVTNLETLLGGKLDAAALSAAPAKGTLASSDKFVIINSVGSVISTSLWSVVTGAMKTINDALYAAASHVHAVATTTVDGFLSAADKVKLNGIASGATANDTDANLKNRANHTGTQGVATITGLGTLATLNDASLTTDVVGILPVANGGTGSSSFPGAMQTTSASSMGVGLTLMLKNNTAGTIAAGGTTAGSNLTPITRTASPLYGAAQAGTWRNDGNQGCPTTSDGLFTRVS